MVDETLLTVESIRAAGETLGLPALNEDAAKELSEEVTYRYDNEKCVPLISWS